MNDLGFYLVANGVSALEICRFADADGKSLTLDELTQRVTDHAKFMEAVQILAMAVAMRGGPRGVKTDPVKTEPVKTQPVTTEPTTGQRAEGRGRVVAGRSVKPRTATGEKYVWSNPRRTNPSYSAHGRDSLADVA